jgi:recombinational DNA repair ATPase RecF
MAQASPSRPGGGGRQDKRQVRLNGVAAQSSADLGDIVQLIWLTPAMDRLFIESAGGRRRFLDRLVQPFRLLPTEIRRHQCLVRSVA